MTMNNNRNTSYSKKEKREKDGNDRKHEGELKDIKDVEEALRILKYGSFLTPLVAFTSTVLNSFAIGDSVDPLHSKETRNRGKKLKLQQKKNSASSSSSNEKVKHRVQGLKSNRVSPSTTINTFPKIRSQLGLTSGTEELESVTTDNTLANSKLGIVRIILKKKDVKDNTDSTHSVSGVNSASIDSMDFHDADCDEGLFPISPPQTARRADKDKENSFIQKRHHQQSPDAIPMITDTSSNNQSSMKMSRQQQQLPISSLYHNNNEGAIGDFKNMLTNILRTNNLTSHQIKASPTPIHKIDLMHDKYHNVRSDTVSYDCDNVEGEENNVFQF
jgi:hypothetical protein